MHTTQGCEPVLKNDCSDKLEMCTVCFKRKGRADILNKWFGLVLRVQNVDVMGSYVTFKLSRSSNVHKHSLKTSLC